MQGVERREHGVFLPCSQPRQAEGHDDERGQIQHHLDQFHAELWTQCTWYLLVPHVGTRAGITEEKLTRQFGTQRSRTHLRSKNTAHTEILRRE